MDKPEKNPYRELMEQVNLTPEARERILTNVQQADLSPQAKKVVPLRSKQQTWRRWASLAACLVVVVAAVLAVPQFRGSDNDTTPPQLTGHALPSGGHSGGFVGCRRLPGDRTSCPPLRPCQHGLYRV